MNSGNAVGAGAARANSRVRGDAILLANDPDEPALRADDHALVGDGAFEAIKVVGGRPFALTRHLTRLRRSLEPLGIALEKRPYTPHLTLARVDPGDHIAELRRQVAQLPQTDWGSFEAQAFHLYESRPGPSGSSYSRLHSLSL